MTDICGAFVRLLEELGGQNDQLTSSVQQLTEQLELVKVHEQCTCTCTLCYDHNTCEHYVLTHVHVHIYCIYMA